MTKKSLTLLISFGVGFVALATLFFFFDLEISKSLGQENPNFLFLILAALGEFPIYLGPIMFGLVYGFTSENKNMRVLYHLVGLGGLYVAFVRLVGGVFETFYTSEIGIIQYSLLAIASLSLYLFMFLLISKVDKESLFKIRDIAFMYLIVSTASFVMVSGIKYVWGRVRFRALSNDYSEYTNFLTINGLTNGLIDTDYRSFPSGHTNAASCILILSLIPARYSSKKWIKYLVLVLCCLYVLTVAISRICVKAHYASDVLFGFGINFACFMVTYFVFKKKGWLHARSNKC